MLNRVGAGVGAEAFPLNQNHTSSNEINLDEMPNRNSIDIESSISSSTSSLQRSWANKVVNVVTKVVVTLVIGGVLLQALFMVYM